MHNKKNDIIHIVRSFKSLETILGAVVAQQKNDIIHIYKFINYYEKSPKKGYIPRCESNIETELCLFIGLCKRIHVLTCIAQT